SLVFHATGSATSAFPRCSHARTFAIRSRTAASVVCDRRARAASSSTAAVDSVPPPMSPVRSHSPQSGGSCSGCWPPTQRQRRLWSPPVHPDDGSAFDRDAEQLAGVAGGGPGNFLDRLGTKCGNGGSDFGQQVRLVALALMTTGWLVGRVGLQQQHR